MKRMQKGVIGCALVVSGQCFAQTAGGASSAPVKEQWKPMAVPVKGPVVYDESRGNWYYKREYYKKGRALYDEIRNKIASLEELQSPFIEKRAESDARVNDFLTQIGLEAGEIEAKLAQLKADLETERARMVELTEAQRETLLEVEDKEAILNGLVKEFKLLTDIDRALDKSVAVVFENVSKAHKYEQNAWQDYDSIAHTMNDKKAEQLYLDMETIDKNISAIIDYLKNTLGTFFSNKVSELDSLIDKVRGEVNTLKEKGVFLSKKIEDEVAADRALREAEAKKMQEEIAAQKKKIKELENRTWWQSFTEWIRGGFAQIKGWFTGAAKSTKKVAKTP